MSNNNKNNGELGNENRLTGDGYTPGANIVVLDRDLCYVAFNAVHQAMMQNAWLADIQLGKPLLEYISAKRDRDAAQNDLQHALSGESFRIVREYGDINRKYYESSYHPLIDETGGVIGVAVISMDATERYDTKFQLADTRENLDRIFRLSPDLLCVASPDGYFKQLNPAWESTLGYSIAELLAKPLIDFIHPDDHDGTFAEIAKQVGGEPTIYFENRYRHKDGSYRWLAWKSFAATEDGKLHAAARDITEWKLADQKLKAEELRFHTLFEHAGDGIFIADGTGRYTDVNTKGCEMLGYTRDEILSMSMTDLVPAQDVKDVSLRMNELAKGKEVIRERFLLRKDGSLCPVEINGRMLPDGSLLGIVRDITERRIAEKKITNSLLEKEALLKEIHHRVKNNLAVISSLLNLQSRSFTDPLVIEAFKESRHRIRSMALIHEKLYRAQDLAHIDFSVYLEALVQGICASGDFPTRHISVKVEAQPIFLKIDEAIPCALIINELVTNCLKHAFPEDRGGTVTVTFNRYSDDSFVLTVSDDGVGIGEDIDMFTSSSFGLELIRLLTQQLEGGLHLSRTEGTSVKIIFPAEPAAEPA